MTKEVVLKRQFKSLHAEDDAYYLKFYSTELNTKTWAVVKKIVL
jgi:hypothetical protein